MCVLVCVRVSGLCSKGTLIEGDMLVNGALLSSFNHTYVQEIISRAETENEREQLSEKLTGCTADRVGGLRYNVCVQICLLLLVSLFLHLSYIVRVPLTLAACTYIFRVQATRADF